MNTKDVRVTGWGAAALAFLPVALIGFPIFGAMFWRIGPGKPGLTASFWITAVVMLILFLILEGGANRLTFGSEGNASRRWGTGWMRLTIGEDGRFSTSKMMVVLWTLAFAFALTFLSAMVWAGGLAQAAAFGGDWNGYFLLLGGPFAASVLAKSITSSKADSGEKSAAAETSVGAVTSSDAGTLSLPDTQYSIFTLVAITYFVGAFLSKVHAYAISAATCEATSSSTECTLGLPEIPAAILALTSLAALTYVGSKAVTTEAPRILSILPANVVVNGQLDVRIVNAPQDLKQGQVVVKFTQEGLARPIVKVPITEPRTVDGVTSFSVSAPNAVGDYEVVVGLPAAETPPYAESVVPAA